MTDSRNILKESDFPQLNELVDNGGLKQKLQLHMGPLFASGEMRVEDCKIDRAYYKPGGGRRIRFTANIRRQNSHEIAEQLFFGQVFRRPKKAQAVFDSLDHDELTQPRFGPAAIYIPEWRMICWAYPNDPKLPGLSVMTNVEKVLSLAQATPERFGLSRPPLTATADMKKYVPGRRCGYMYHMTLPPAKTDSGNSLHAVYGKAYGGRQGRDAYALTKQIWLSEASRRADLLLPQPYSYDADHQILWQESLSGEPLAKIADSIRNLAGLAKEIGRRLAAFHNSQLDLSREKTIDFEINELHEKMVAINDSFHHDSETCNAVMNKLLAAAPKLGPGNETPIHASFKFSHIFSTDRGIVFIDFDGANLGDPAYDLGRFIAHLHNMKARQKIAPAVAEQTIANFCESYNKAAAYRVPQERIDWFAASHLLTSQVYKAVKRMNPKMASKLWKVADRLCPS